ncbi:hypothetical protein E2320_022184 [Naja naja]|nr:hypothetical protein E2320_022184 [Naja naja]
MVKGGATSVHARKAAGWNMPPAKRFRSATNPHPTPARGVNVLKTGGFRRQRRVCSGGSPGSPRETLKPQKPRLEPDRLLAAEAGRHPHKRPPAEIEGPPTRLSALRRRPPLPKASLPQTRKAPPPFPSCSQLYQPTVSKEVYFLHQRKAIAGDRRLAASPSLHARPMEGGMSRTPPHPLPTSASAHGSTRWLFALQPRQGPGEKPDIQGSAHGSQWGRHTRAGQEGIIPGPFTPLQSPWPASKGAPG